MRYMQLAEEFRACGCEAETEVPMSSLTTFRIGGPASLLVTVPDVQAARVVLRRCQQERVPVLLLGNGSNLLVSDKGIEGVVFRLTAENSVLKIEPDETHASITCNAGIPLKQLCRIARDHALSGLEFAYGIPGSVGGAVYMNAGAYEGQIADVLTSVSSLNTAGQIVERSADCLMLGYRHSLFMENHELILSATFTLAHGCKDEIAARMDEYMRRRREKQPLEYPSAGSFFKRPQGYYAGALIERAGLKGYRIGDAQISEKHAGFVVNRGEATCAQVLELSAQVSERVMDVFGVQMEREVLCVGIGMGRERQ